MTAPLEGQGLTRGAAEIALLHFTGVSLSLSTKKKVVT